MDRQRKRDEDSDYTHLVIPANFFHADLIGCWNLCCRYRFCPLCDRLRALGLQNLAGYSLRLDMR